MKAPIYIGIMPLTSSQNAEFLHNEVPGIKLTDEVRARMALSAGNRELSTREGLEISKELIDVALQVFSWNLFNYAIHALRYNSQFDGLYK